MDFKTETSLQLIIFPFLVMSEITLVLHMKWRKEMKMHFSYYWGKTVQTADHFYFISLFFTLKLPCIELLVFLKYHTFQLLVKTEWNLFILFKALLLYYSQYSAQTWMGILLMLSLFAKVRWCHKGTLASVTVNECIWYAFYSQRYPWVAAPVDGQCQVLI